jgi:predicted acylesterase/phospholipase RssA
MHFSSIVVAGGALKVISVIGCIKYLEEKSMLKNIKNFVGTSAGSIMCLFMVLGYTYLEIVEFLHKNLEDDTISKFNPSECLELFSNYGLNSGKNLEDFIQRIVFKKLKKNDITFIELTKLTGKNLVVCVSNLSKEKSEFFNVDTMSHLSIVTAIRVSCSIPLMLTPLTINGDLYLDGALYNNFPIDYFEQSVRDILGINIMYKNYQKTDNVFDYIKFVLSTLLEKANSLNFKSFNDSEKNVVTLDFEEDDWFSLTELSIKFPKEKWDTYIEYGYQQIKRLYFT